MEKRKIGSLEVSVVGLGCNNFGWRVDANGTAKVVDARLAERDKKRADKTKAAGQRRSNERRATIPAIIADIVFGKDS